MTDAPLKAGQESADQGVVEESAPGKRNVARRLVDYLFSPWMKEAENSSYDWQLDSHRAFIEQQPLRARALLYAVAAIVVALVIWSSLAKIDEVTRGQGRVIPSRQIQIIQSQDGGVVTEIRVREGETVEKGQLLVLLDQTRSEATFRENRAEYQAVMVKAARLRAVAENTAFVPDLEFVEAVPLIVKQELALFEFSRAELTLEKQIAEEQLTQRKEDLQEFIARREQMGTSLKLVQRELTVTSPMVAS
jgi:adhesin transport system membrane fusion protein